jgi:S-DNA-T family DNA segregation ATPase FtsK/SpoIIIE
MIGGTLIATLALGTSSLTYMIPMFVMSLGFPIANVIGLASQKKTYRHALEQREKTYRQKLAETRQRLEALVQQQRSLLEDAYPTLRVLERMALARDKLMWSRRPPDDDFLSLRFGKSDSQPSFTIEPPRYSDPNDKLPGMALEVARDFQKVPDMPSLLELSRVGSVAINGRASSAYGLTRRLVLDIIVHHSPQDVNIVVLGDTRAAVENWEWLKWIPHTDSLEAEKRLYRLAFDPLKIDKYLEVLMNEYRTRRSLTDSVASSNRMGNQPAIVVLVDDSGLVRQHGDIHTLAEWGYEGKIYLIFVGGRDWPRECRSRIDLLDERNFKFIETWTKSGELREGTYESASCADCERVARTLAGWDVAGSGSRVPLPESIRISKVLGMGALSGESVKQSWSTHFEPKDLLQFPIGVCARRDQLNLAMINLLPADRGGNDAYHTILIGTTGSGKSEFMKSLVMGAAVCYPPDLLNFFFLDFKGGAAFSIFEDLPHVSGVVTNLRPELVERGLDSIRNEIERRQEEFSNTHVQNIWDYNRSRTDHSLPHLVLFLDEFARGLADFPRLRETLDVLVRQGRSLGMYLILANQDVNSEVDKLLNNVGWRIALKVAKPEEMHMIDRALPSATRAGQGYLRSLNGYVTEFQAGYAGLPLQRDTPGEGDEFAIYEVEADGSYKQVFKKTSDAIRAEKKDKGPSVKEEEFIIATLKQAATELHIRPTARIYLDPLPEIIPLDDIFSMAGVKPCYQNKKWTLDKEVRRMIACWGEQDIPKQCLQEILKTDFNDRDGHLWIMGAQGSGRDTALVSLLMSLALMYTPEQLQFYMLDLGAGELAQFAALPHTGAVICPQKEDTEENERLVRLLDFLDSEMQERTKTSKQSEKEKVSGPTLFVVINSFAELRANFADEVERMTRFVRDGSRVGIHFIITTSRGAELIRSISNIISRRLVLQLANKEEYIEAVGKQVAPISGNIPGRAYWVDGDVSICQAAQPPAKLREMMQAMRESWKGELPRPVEVLPSCISFSSFLEQVQSYRQDGEILIPVGKAYETLELVALNLPESSPFWLILGPKESGKSNFLACAAQSVLEQDTEDNWLLKAYAFRRSPLLALGQKQPRLSVLNSADEILKDCQALIELLKNGKPPEGKRLLLLIDDLGFAFQPGRESLMAVLNSMTQNLESVTDVVIMTSSLLDELRMQLASPLVKLLRQNRTGVVLSKDTNEIDWLGASISLEYRRMELPVGRGFFINKGKAQLVQTPLMGDFEK